MTEFGQSLRHVRLVIELLDRSGAGDAAGVVDLLHPELEVLAIPGMAPGKGYRSREEFLGYFEDAGRIGQRIETDVSRVRVSPSGSVIVDGALRITVGENTEVVDAWFVYGFRDGLIATLGNYLEPAQAERAAGLV